MTIFLITFAVLLIAVLAMSVGFLFNNQTIKGSCGGIASIPGMEDYKSNCSCDKPCEKKLARLAAEQQQQTTEQPITFKKF